jgi:hypothetical protein
MFGMTTLWARGAATEFGPIELENMMRASRPDNPAVLVPSGTGAGQGAPIWSKTIATSYGPRARAVPRRSTAARSSALRPWVRANQRNSRRRGAGAIAPPERLRTFADRRSRGRRSIFRVVFSRALRRNSRGVGSSRRPDRAIGLSRWDNCSDRRNKLSAHSVLSQFRLTRYDAVKKRLQKKRHSVQVPATTSISPENPHPRLSHRRHYSAARQNTSPRACRTSFSCNPYYNPTLTDLGEDLRPGSPPRMPALAARLPLALP